jgi:hypothetical protein
MLDSLLWDFLAVGVALVCGREQSVRNDCLDLGLCFLSFVHELLHRIYFF